MVNGAREVGGQHLLDRFAGNHAEQRVREHAGVVDQYVQAFEPAEDHAVALLDRGRIRNAAGKARAGHAKVLLQDLDTLLEQIGVVCPVQDYRRAGLREGPGGSPTDAARGSGDEGDLAVKPEGQRHACEGFPSPFQNCSTKSLRPY